MPGFVTDAAVKTSVAAALHKTAAELPSLWTDIITDANTAAYHQIQVHFLTLGFTQDQIDAWDHGTTFQKFLARYQALIDGAGDKDSGLAEWRTELDYWRGKLEETLVLVTDDESEEPDTSSSAVGRGRLRTTDDIFRLDPDGRGEVTQW